MCVRDVSNILLRRRCFLDNEHVDFQQNFQGHVWNSQMTFLCYGLSLRVPTQLAWLYYIYFLKIQHLWKIILSKKYMRLPIPAPFTVCLKSLRIDVIYVVLIFFNAMCKLMPLSVRPILTTPPEWLMHTWLRS